MKVIKLFLIFSLLMSFVLADETVILNSNKEKLFDFNSESKSISHINLSLEINRFNFEYKIENGTKYIFPLMSGMGLYYREGMPMLPIIRRKILVPENGEVFIKVKNVEWDTIQLDGILYPRQKSQFKNEPKNPFFIDNEYYESGKTFPDNGLCRIYRKGIVRGHNFVGVELVPFKFTSVDNLLHVAKSVEFEVIIEGGDVNKTYQEIDKKYSRELSKGFSNKFINYNNYKSDTKDYYGEGMVILYGSESFKQDIPGELDFTDIVSWKRKKGWKVEEYVVGTDVNNSEADIRAFISNLYNTWSNPSLGYLLIVGDVDTVPSSSLLGHATDHYYSCLDGDFSSDLMDRDVHVSRISLNIGEEATVIPVAGNKIVNYEKANYSDYSWMKKFCLIAGHDSSNCAAFGYHTQESVRENHTNNPACPDYPITGTWPNNPEPGGDMIYSCVVSPQASSDGTEIKLAANDGRALINYTAHGSHASWADPNITIPDVFAFSHPEAKPFMIGHCCVTGTFTQSTDCLGEGAFKAPNGAIVYLGASMNTLWNEDDVMGRQMYDGMFGRDHSYTYGSPSNHGSYVGPINTGTTFAALANVGLEDLENYQGQTNYVDDYFVSYHCFGDASVDMWTNIPTDLVVDTAPVHAVGVPVKEVRVYDSKTKAPIEGAVVCFSNSEFKVMALTDATGLATLNFTAPPVQVQLADLIITGHNLKPYQATVQIIAASCGVVLLNKSTFNCGSIVEIDLYDADLTAPTFNVDINSTSNPSMTSVSLTKSEYGYEGTIQLVPSNQTPGAGQLAVDNGDTITVYYSDADCDGTPQNVNDSATIDCNGPVISNVAWTTDLGEFNITWDTNEAATSKIEFGNDMNNLNLMEESTNKTTTHSLSATDLGEATWFFVRITSTDNYGNTTIDNNNGEYYKIPVPGKLYLLNENMDNNPNWAINGVNWGFGIPTGGCSGNNDPSSAYTGTNVYGVNLDGCYPNDMNEETLTTGAIDCSQHSQLYLSFAKWNGCESSQYDHSLLQISNDGTNWNTLWENGSSFNDSAWAVENYDISTYAANQPTVYIRWVMGETDGSQTYSGWNIDDVQVFTTQDPDPLEPVPSMTTIGLILILGIFSILVKKFKN